MRASASRGLGPVQLPDRISSSRSKIMDKRASHRSHKIKRRRFQCHDDDDVTHNHTAHSLTFKEVSYL